MERALGLAFRRETKLGSSSVSKQKDLDRREAKGHGQNTDTVVGADSCCVILSELHPGSH